jgi:hypothetical protein
MPRYVVVEDNDNDNEAVNSSMTRCSKFEHEGAARAQAPTPAPSELNVNIEARETWCASVERRKLMIEARRKDRPRPPSNSSTV